MNVRYFVCCAALILLAQAAFATSYYYVSPTGSDLNDGLTAAHSFQSIGHAIGVSPSGSTVLIAPGTYTGHSNVDLTVAHNVSLVAQGTPTNTIVDMAGTSASLHRALTVNQGITLNLTGITFQNGYEYRNDTAGILSMGGTLNLKDCNFKNNTGVYTPGGAIHLTGGSVTATNCTFYGNSAHDGGAIETDAGAIVKCSQCTFEHCRASYSGAGLCLIGGTATLTQCNFIGNLCTYGLAIIARGTTVTLQQCNVTHQVSAGGMNVILGDNASSLYMYNSTFNGNFAGEVAELGGGGEIKGCRFIGNQCGTENLLHLGSGFTAVLANNLFVGNQSASVIVNDGDLALTLCTVAENDCTGGAVVNNSYANIGSSIFWNNGPDFVDGAGAHTTITKTNAPETANLDPGFVSVPNGDYHLGPNSPCIGVGDPAATQTYSSDIEGRYRHSVPSLGCFESLTVDPVATALGADGFKRILWFDTNGQIQLWRLSSAGAVLQISKFTTLAGLAASALVMGADNRAYIFLKSSSGNAVTVLTVATNGTLAGTKTYTPAAGWDFKSADVSSDNAVHLIWRNTHGTVLYWDVTAGGTSTTHTYGPLLG